jgi:hypothetical protein
MPELDGFSLGALVVPVIWILEIHKVILGVLVVPVIWILEIHKVIRRLWFFALYCFIILVFEI